MEHIIPPTEQTLADNELPVSGSVIMTNNTNHDLADSGTVKIAGDYLVVRKKNGIVTVYGSSLGTIELTQGSARTLGTLPSYACPSADMYF